MALINEYFDLNEKYLKLYSTNMILLIQVGSFFEVYGKKNKSTNIITSNQIGDFARICELNVVDKNIYVASVSVDESIVMAGFKDVMIDKYLKKLQDAGFTIVVYVQDQQAKNTTRSLAGIFSPGTYFGTEDNHQLTNNTTCIWIEYVEYKTSIFSSNGKIVIVGVANLDIYTGKTSIFQFTEVYANNPTTYDELERFISIYNPTEAIIISNLPSKEIEDIIQYINIQCKSIHKIGDDDYKNSELVKNSEKQTYQLELLRKFYPSMNIDVMFETVYDNHIATQSFCYLLDFIYKHNPHLVNNISEPIFENCSQRLILANHSLKQLNIIQDNLFRGKYSSVIKMLNCCVTAMGKRKFAYDFLNPTTDIDYLQKEYDITEHVLLTYHNQSHPFFVKLSEVSDISKFTRQIIMKKISPKQIYQLYYNLQTIRHIYDMLKNDDTFMTYLKHPNIVNYCDLICDFITSNIEISLCKNLDYCDTNFIKRGINQELDDNTKILMESHDQLITITTYLNSLISIFEKNTKVSDYIKCHETEKNHFSLISTKRRSLLLKNALTNKSVKLTYVSSYSGEVSSLIFDCSTSNMVLVAYSATNNQISCPQIDTLCRNIGTIKSELKTIINKVYVDILGQLESYQPVLENIINFVTLVDVVSAKMTIAKKYTYCKPVICKDADKSFIEATDLRHCLIENIQQNEIYVPNDITLGNGIVDGILLYGTNAVGKTSFIRSIGIAVIMAQAGLYVPASSFKFNPYKYIFTRILGNDNLFKGLSTFAVEMYELRTILRFANSNSLILGDELCSGTESTSAISIFVAGIQNIHEKNSSFIFSTHLHEIVEYEEITNLTNVKQMHMEVVYDRENDILIYDRKLKDGPGTNTYGLEVCKSLDLPVDFLNLAHQIRVKYHPKYNNVLSMKRSHFNTKKLMTLCEMCKKKVGTEVHHLQHQSHADNAGTIIPTSNSCSPFNKNHLANLVTLCERCHTQLHDTGDEHKKIKTSHGMRIVNVDYQKSPGMCIIPTNS